MMEGLKDTIEALSQSFTQRMASFEDELKKTAATQQPSLSSLSAEFSAFREFVMATLENLEQQVTVLKTECDNMEMRSRRAMLLLHGVSEVMAEIPTEALLKVASRHLASVELCETQIIWVSRLGIARPDKSRPLLIKLQSESLRDILWAAKTSLKGTGITMSEFLTKHRYGIFVAARARLGVAKCWTSAGRIMAVGHDGRRHRIVSLTDIDKLAELDTSISMATTSAAVQREPHISALAPKDQELTAGERFNMEDFLGKEYLMVSEENFEAYLEHLGLGYFKRKIAVSVRPVQCLTRTESGAYKFTVKSALFTWDMVFEPGVMFDGVKPDGGKIKSLITFEGNIMTHRQLDSQGINSVHVKEFTPEETITTTTVEGTDIVVKRVYELVK